MSSNFGARVDSWKSPGLVADKEVNPKGNQSWIFIGRTDAEAETPILWPPDGKIWLIRKDRDAGKDWRQKEKGAREDEIVGWHYQLNGHEFEQTPGDTEGQRSLVCCGSWGHKELGMTEQLNNNELIWRSTNLFGTMVSNGNSVLLFRSSLVSHAFKASY